MYYPILFLLFNFKLFHLIPFLVFFELLHKS